MPRVTVALALLLLPVLVAAAPDSYWVCVTNEKSGDVTVIDGATQKLVATIPVGKRPWGLALSPDQKLAYVANGLSNDVSVLDLATEKEVGRVKAGDGPWGVTVVPAPAGARLK